MRAPSTSAPFTGLGNLPNGVSLNGADFRQPIDEVMQFIELIQDAYGSNPGSTANNRMNFWAAASLLRLWVTSLFDAQIANVPTSFTRVNRA
jgi:hypothetical protein